MCGIYELCDYFLKIKKRGLAWPVGQAHWTGTVRLTLSSAVLEVEHVGRHAGMCRCQRLHIRDDDRQ